NVSDAQKRGRGVAFCRPGVACRHPNCLSICYRPRRGVRGPFGTHAQGWREQVMGKLTKGLLAGAAVGLGAWFLSRARRRPVRFDFRDRVVLITGGSRGLGLVLGRKLAERGARVAVCARDREELERAGEDLTGFGDWPLALPCDVTDPGQVRDL